MTMTMTKLEAALWYAGRGYPVFPCIPGTKFPFAGSAGSKDATTDTQQITTWWTHSPDANVAIGTGHTSRLYVVDIDAPVSALMPLLPTTWTARTRSGGWHYIYQMPDGMRLPNTAKGSPNAVHVDADTRGEGGYILVFPSVVEGAPYAWINDIDPVPLPQWIIDKVKPRPTVALVQSSFRLTSTSWAEKALDEECMSVASTSEGGRNQNLIRASFKIGQIVGSGHLSPGVAADRLLSSALSCGLGQRESMSTITRGIKAGTDKPRNPASKPVEVFDAGYYLDADEVIAVVDKPKKKTDKQRDADRWGLLNDVRALGGLCDSFSGWVIRGADHAQPGLTIAALIALGSAVAGRRLIYRRSTSSLYVVSLASSGEGKNRPQSCLSRVLDDVWPALRGPNSFSSGPSFVDGVRTATNAGVATCMVLDEYGMQLANMMGPRAASHRQDIKQSLTELSTKGSDKWSPALSLVKGGGKIDLVAPVVVLLGSTTPESLHSVLTSTDVADGFVGRHVWMRAQSVLPEWQPTETRGDDGSIPAEVRAAVAAIRLRHEAWHLALPDCSSNGLDVSRVYDPINVADDEDARLILTECKFKADNHRRDGTRKQIPNAVLARLPEFASRVALALATLAQPESDCPCVTGEIARVAVAIAEESAETFAASLANNQRPDWNDPEAQARYVMSALRQSSGGMDWSDLLRGCRRLTARTISEVVDRLAEEKEIAVDSVQGQGRTGKAVRILKV